MLKITFFNTSPDQQPTPGWITPTRPSTPVLPGDPTKKIEPKDPIILPVGHS